eukprot:CAMPEP_0176103124 /NCGR_PEP_ID=MMETSP0120_2-20121206/51735_1 /TAXON_ID=160619 /ORGANISM="Kryptoperidinium foliaceum, Strain CCMP 1326" /LENGTH=197 /DNA_ID=CAMNT_0017437203 /DNA_START=66 /DNA_END=659 /DNA_ORIENTATION=-
MTPTQELFNAASMVVPTLICTHVWFTMVELGGQGPRTALILVGIMLHLPFSVAYHLLLARRSLRDAVANTPRKLDQSFIHVMSILATWALSPSTSYAVLSTTMNVYFVARLWSKRNTLTERMCNIGLGTLLYGLAAVMGGYYIDFALGALWFVSGAVAMDVGFGGWGHSIMHLCMGGLAYHCMICASNIQLREHVVS